MPDTGPMVSRASTLVEAEMADEMVGLRLATSSCFGFNDTAYRVWQLIEHPTSVDDLCLALTREYAVDAETCRQELMPLLRYMVDAGLATLSGPPPWAGAGMIDP